MRWREPIGTMLGTAALIVWVGLGAIVALTASLAFEQHSKIGVVLVLGIATIFAAGGLVIFWSIAEQVKFWSLGYRVRQVSPKGFLRWTPGPKQCVYEERAPSGQIQALPFIRIVLGDGYPAPCEVCLPREEDWNTQIPSWAHGRRKEIMERMNKCFGGERSRTRIVELG
jgi:hypothetical protein